MEALYGIMLPFLGTSLGAAGVFFMRGRFSGQLRRALSGFAAGVMVAASVWSLLIPAIEQAEYMGIWSFVPAVAGFWMGVLLLLGLDSLVSRLYMRRENGAPERRLRRTAMLVLAVTLHNIPEGLAVGVAYAGYLSEGAAISAARALALSLGVAIQNLPEGAIIALPLRAEGSGRTAAFAGGVLSGVVEPIGAGLTLLAARLILPALPYLLGLAAGAMLHVVASELIPEATDGRASRIGALAFAAGFSAMMLLDVALG